MNLCTQQAGDPTLPQSNLKTEILPVHTQISKIQVHLDLHLNPAVQHVGRLSIMYTSHSAQAEQAAPTLSTGRRTDSSSLTI